jgi:hypothetical protein
MIHDPLEFNETGRLYTPGTEDRLSQNPRCDGTWEENETRKREAKNGKSRRFEMRRKGQKKARVVLDRCASPDERDREWFG